ncbi:hypothetical protein D3C72_2277950 [compost metagenome]
MGVCLGDQLIEHRVFEHLPPLTAVGLRVFLVGELQGRSVPVLNPRLGWRLEIRTQLYATAENGGATQEQPVDASKARHQTQTPQTGC